MAKLPFGHALGAGLVLLAASVSPSFAAASLIVNGDFDTAPSTSQQMTTSNVYGWTTTGYNFIYLASSTAASKTTADTTGATNSDGKQIKLWGPGDGSNNGLTTSPGSTGVPSSGGNFISADNNYGQSGISQTVTGLVKGVTYALSFYWAAAQEWNFDGDTQEQWRVTFADSTTTQTKYTDQVTLASHAFSGWKQVTMLFTATSASEVLTFLATGSPGGNPPYSLLDGVSLTAVPEPATWAMLVAGVVGLAGLTWHRRRGAAPSAGAQA